MKLGILLLGIALSSPAAVAASEPSMNVRVNPLGLVLGVAGAQVDFGLDEKLTLGPTFEYLSVSSTVGTSTSSASALALGVRANVFLTGIRFADGWYLGPSATYAMAKSGDTKANGIAVGAVAGYAWYWNSGINIHLGLGAQYFGIDSDIISIGGILPSAEFSLGYVF